LMFFRWWCLLKDRERFDDDEIRSLMRDVSCPLEKAMTRKAEWSSDKRDYSISRENWWGEILASSRESITVMPFPQKKE
jgi:valyl-tRNA synthetase